jgi:nitrate/nitrite transporter NarK
MWVAIPLDVVCALLVMRLAAFGEMKEGVAKQFAIFSNKHTWSMTALYIVTFGSFIGFSMALAAVDHGDLRHQPRSRRQRRAAAHAEESQTHHRR